MTTKTDTEPARTVTADMLAEHFPERVKYRRADELMKRISEVERAAEVLASKSDCVTVRLQVEGTSISDPRQMAACTIKTLPHVAELIQIELRQLKRELLSL